MDMLTKISKKYKPITTVDAYRDQARFYSVLGDPTRLWILNYLLNRGEGLVTQTQLLDGLFPMAQPTVSHHLRLLQYGGLVENYKAGLNRYYSLTKPELVRQIVSTGGLE